MQDAFSRTEMLIGTEGLNKLRRSNVAIFGIGGVGSYAAEAIARSGVGRLVLVDDDCVCLTNINRQIHSTHKTIGKPKVEVMKERILDINPKAQVEIHQLFYSRENGEELICPEYDYVIDAIDTISAKIDMATRCFEKGIPIISSMGAGNKMDPTSFQVADLYETTVDPIAKVMRRELKRRGVTRLKVVYSKEPPISLKEIEYDCRTHCVCTNNVRICTKKRAIPGSIAFIPSVVGLIIAGEVIKGILESGNNERRERGRE